MCTQPILLFLLNNCVARIILWAFPGRKKWRFFSEIRAWLKHIYTHTSACVRLNMPKRSDSACRDAPSRAFECKLIFFWGSGHIQTSKRRPFKAGKMTQDRTLAFKTPAVVYAPLSFNAFRRWIETKICPKRYKSRVFQKRNIPNDRSYLLYICIVTFAVSFATSWEATLRWERTH